LAVAFGGVCHFVKWVASIFVVGFFKIYMVQSNLKSQICVGVEIMGISSMLLLV